MIDVNYTKAERKHCDKDKYSHFTTVAEAQKNCTQDPKCGKVYDNGCHQNDLFLCPVGSLEGKSGSSCLWVKPGKTCRSFNHHCSL